MWEEVVVAAEVVDMRAAAVGEEADTTEVVVEEEGEIQDEVDLMSEI